VDPFSSGPRRMRSGARVNLQPTAYAFVVWSAFSWLQNCRTLVAHVGCDGTLDVFAVPLRELPRSRRGFGQHDIERHRRIEEPVEVDAGAGTDELPAAPSAVE
jgi:hypothetical protein